MQVDLGCYSTGILAMIVAGAHCATREWLKAAGLVALAIVVIWVGAL